MRSSALICAMAFCLNACTTAAQGGYGPQADHWTIGGAFGYKETKTGDKSWFVQYNGSSAFDAVEGFNRRARELCSGVGYSNYDVSAVPGLASGTTTGVAAPVPGGMLATASQTIPSQSAYITCK